jgi:hypothetical protein
MKDVEKEDEGNFKIGQEVEVSSDEEGFRGAWFVGTILQSNLQNSQFLIEYHTLLEDDGQSPLKELINTPYIRPKPPSLLDPPNFRVNDFVDALHLDAWWPGLISRVLPSYEFLVTFKDPFEQIIFSGYSLRYHQDWRNGVWIQSQFQEMDWKDVAGLDSEMVNQSRAKRTRRPKKIFNFDDSTTGSNKSNNARSGEIEDVINYPIEVHFQQEDNDVDEVNNKRRRGRAKLTIRKKGKEAPPLSPPLLPPPAPTMKSSSEVVDGNKNGNNAVANKRKRGRPFKRPILNQTKTVKAGGHADSGEKCTAGTSNSIANSDYEVLPISVEDGISSQTTNDESRASPDLSATKSGKEIIIMQDEEEVFVGPFMKCSPLWKTLESMDAFKRIPQNPHFSNLSNCEEQFREGLAIGCMVTFANTVDRISKLKISDPTSLVERYFETLAELENHGFNVEMYKACLKELIAKKVRDNQLQEESKKVVGELATRRLVMKEIENEIIEIEAKIEEHKQQHEDIIAKKEKMDKELSNLEMQKDKIGEDINNIRLKFENMVALAP